MNAPIERHLKFEPELQAEEGLHRRLALFNRKRMLPAFPVSVEKELDDEMQYRFEEGWLSNLSGCRGRAVLQARTTMKASCNGLPPAHEVRVRRCLFPGLRPKLHRSMRWSSEEVAASRL